MGHRRGIPVSLRKCLWPASCEGKFPDEVHKMEGETCDARFNDVAVHRSFLRLGVSVRQGLPEVEVIRWMSSLELR
jgi:hypothetical protein